MKKFSLILAIVAIFAVGCQTDNTSDNAVGVGDGAILSVALPQTRTSLGEPDGNNYPVYWSEGDKIVVNGTLSEEIKINAEDNSRAEFLIKPTPSYPLHITYPYCATTTAEQAVVEFAAEQAHVEGSFALGSAPMCGYAEVQTKTVAMKHLAGVLRFPVKAKFAGSVLEKIVITAENSIAGEFNVDCQSVTIAPTANVSNVVTYSLPSNFALSTTKESVFYIALPAVELGGCTVEFIETTGEKMVATWSPSKPLSKGVVREFNTIIYEPKSDVVLQALEAVADEFAVYYKDVHGYVRYSDGSPIANVAVSDGFQVVTTDSNGYYEMSGVTRDTWYIYCSLPADIKVPINEFGRPCFFQKYPANSPQYDFTFEKLPGGKENKFSILAMADTQPGAMSSVERFKAQAAPEIKSYSANSASNGVPCYGIVLGDVIYSASKTNNEYLMPEMREALNANRTGIPVFTVFGNHDNAYFTENKPIFPDERSSTYNLKIQRPFEECFGPINYSFNRGDAHIVCMRDMQWDTNTSAAGANTTTSFTDEQYEWVKQDLAIVPKDKMVILCVHVPIFNKGVKAPETNKHLQNVLYLLDEFAEAHVLSGHLHYRECYDHIANNTGHKVYEQSWSSVAVVAYGNGANINCDGAPTGYGVVTIENGRMVKSIHKGYAYGMNSEDYQIRLHRGNDITGAAIPEGDANKYKTKGYYQFGFGEDVILANVFSSDPETWTVEVWLYNKETGERTTKIGNMVSLEPYCSKPTYDKLVGSYTYEDPKRPDNVVSGREFWTVGVLLGHLGNTVDDRYHECHTLWKLDLSEYSLDKTADVMVVARDRWGNEYTQTEFQIGTDPGYAIYDPANNPAVE